MRDRLQSATRIFLHVLTLGNLMIGVGFAGALLLSFPFEAKIGTRLIAKYGPRIDYENAIDGLRLAMLVGITSAVALHHMLKGLAAILASVGDGDPFVVENGDRLARIGWALLALQMLDLVAGALIGWFRYLGFETATWTPSFVGWLGVLLAFVLARVFRRGAEMRDDLAMTV